MCPNFSDKKHKRDGQPNKPKDHLEHIPFRLREIMKSKERMKAGPKKTKKLPKGEKGFHVIHIVFAGISYNRWFIYLCLSSLFPWKVNYRRPRMEIYLSHISRGVKGRVRKHTWGAWTMRPNTSCSSLRTRWRESLNWRKTNKRSLRTRASLRRRRSEYFYYQPKVLICLFLAPLKTYLEESSLTALVFWWLRLIVIHSIGKKK